MLTILNDNEIGAGNNCSTTSGPLGEYKSNTKERLIRFLQKNRKLTQEEINRELNRLLGKNEKISSEDIRNGYMKLLEEKKRMPIEDIDKELKEQYNYRDIYEKFSPIVEEEYILTHHRVYFHKRNCRKDKEQINQSYINSEYYQAGRRLRRHFESFCSMFDTRISGDEALNNGKIIKALGFEDLFNNVYRVLLTLEEKYIKNRIDGETYFEEVTCLLYYLRSYMEEGREINKPIYKKYAETKLPELR